MASKYVALIRGINVGRAKRVAMADLRAMVEGLGYRDVATLLNSGNVAFTAPGKVPGDPGPRIEAGLADRLGVPARVIVLTGAGLAAAVAGNPLLGVATDPSRLLVGVLGDPADQPRLEPLARQDWGPEAFALGPRVAYLWCPEGMLASPLATAFNRAMGAAVTTRNWSTMTKLNALVEALP